MCSGSSWEMPNLVWVSGSDSELGCGPLARQGGSQWISFWLSAYRDLDAAEPRERRRRGIRMNRIFVAVIFLWATASAAEIRYGDGTYVQHFTSGGDAAASTTNHVAAHGVHGFGVQTGYEGYLVPTKGSSEGGWDLHRGLLAGLVPLAKLALISPFTGGVWLFLALTALVGAGLVCSFTPVCGFNPLGLGRYYLNQDNLNSATAFVMDAIEKHRDQQKKPATAKKEE